MHRLDLVLPVVRYSLQEIKGSDVALVNVHINYRGKRTKVNQPGIKALMILNLPAQYVVSSSSAVRVALIAEKVFFISAPNNARSGMQ